MLAGTHVLIGYATYQGFALSGTLPDNSLFLAVASAGALAPDLDHINSYAGKRFPVISFTFGSLFGHRGFTHSLVGTGMFIAGFYILCTMLSPELYPWGFYAMIAFGVGYLSHIASDALTNSGVPLFWPNPKRIRFLGISTGTFPEKIISFAGAVVVVWQVISRTV